MDKSDCNKFPLDTTSAEEDLLLSEFMQVTAISGRFDTRIKCKSIFAINHIRIHCLSV